MKLDAVTSPGRAAFCPEMRITVLVAILMATAACGAYRFPGPGNATGTVTGQVVSFGCGGPVQPAMPRCLAKPTSNCVPQAPDSACAEWPTVGLDLVFNNGTTILRTKTDTAGAYSIELPVGTWKVTTATFVRIIDGPQTLVVNAGAAITANYIVDSGIRAAA